MAPNQTTDMASDVGQADKKPRGKAQNGVRKVSPKARTARRSSAKIARSRAAKRPARRSSLRSAGGSTSILNDAYGMARDSRKKISKAAREALPSNYTNDKSLILAAVGLSVSVAVGALLMGYGNFSAKRTSGGPKRASERELIAPRGDKRYIRRDNEGRIKESDDVSRSLSQDRRKKAKTEVKPGQGDRGDRRPA